VRRTGVLRKRLRQLLLDPHRRNAHQKAADGGGESENGHGSAVFRTRLRADTQASEDLISLPSTNRHACGSDRVRVDCRHLRSGSTTMSFLRKMIVIGAVVSAIGVPAAVAQMQGMDMQKMMQAMMPSTNDPASTKDFKQAHMDMMKNMNMEFSGDADADFARSMIPHHQGAIDMAKLELKYGKDRKMRQMAEKMIKDQQKEQKDFQAFLQKKKK
jgi:hypothetical protein